MWGQTTSLDLIKETLVFYKSPANFSYLWNFGFLALIFLVVQMVSGIFLAMFYNADINSAFGTIYNMSSEMYYGWLLSNIHSNGASFFFLTVYLHISRNLYYSSFMFPRELLWISGAMLWILMIATAFLGYVLPWGQMSFWGAMVMTSLLGAMPGMGNDILFLLWGDYSMSGVTLFSFYALHFTLPFVIMGLVFIHLHALHEKGSSNPTGLYSKLDTIPMMPYYGIKDTFSLIIVLQIFLLFMVLAPDKLGHSDNFILANPLVTPAHIVPEWYFLPLYAVLRSVTNKLLGVVLMALAILCVMIFPFFCKYFMISSGSFRPIYGFIMLMFMFMCLYLGWIGSLPVITPYLEFGQFVTFMFFSMIMAMLPLLGNLEQLCYSAKLWIFLM